MRVSTLTLFVSCLLLSCKKEQSNSNEPCQGITPFNDGFTIQQEVGDTIYTCDTVFLNSYINFVPNSLTGSAKWEIPSGGLIDSNLIFRLFINDGLNSSVSVSLTQNYIPHASCFPDETGISTNINSFFITDYGESLIKGKFQGSLKGAESDTFTIWIRYFPSPAPNYFLSNLPKGCTRSIFTGYPSEIGYSIDAGYRSLTFDGTTCQPNSIKGKGIIIGKDSISITYLQNDNSDPNIKHSETFLGKRIK